MSIGTLKGRLTAVMAGFLLMAGLSCTRAFAGDEYGITQVVPATAHNTGQVSVELQGYGFSSDTRAKLARDGQPDIIASGVVLNSPTSLTCTFSLANATTGEWHVVVSTFDAGTISARAFHVGKLDGIRYDEGCNKGAGDGYINASDSNGVIEIDYTGGCGWAAWWINTRPSLPVSQWSQRSADDLSACKVLSFDVEFPAPCSVKVGMKERSYPDDGWETKLDLDTSVTGWQTRSYAINSFGRYPNPIDQTQVYIPLEFVFGGDPVHMHVRNIKATDGKLPVNAVLPNAFSVTAVPPPLAVSAVSPAAGYNNGTCDVYIAGTGFTPDAAVTLLRGGQVVATAATTYTGPNSLLCSFDLAGKTVGYCDVQVTCNGTSVTRQQAFMVRSLTLSSINPSSGFNDRTVIISGIAGSGFVQGMSVKLCRAGQNDINATNIAVSNGGTSLSCWVNLDGRAPGMWDLAVSTGALSGSKPFYVGGLAGGYDQQLGGGVNAMNEDAGSGVGELFCQQSAWGVYTIILQPAAPLGSRSGEDLSRYEMVSFDIRGADGGETVQVGIKDKDDFDDGLETKLPVSSVGTDWQTFRFPLSAFATCNLRCVYSPFELVFGTSAAHVWLRNIRYGPGRGGASATLASAFEVIASTNGGSSNPTGAVTSMLLTFGGGSVILGAPTGEIRASFPSGCFPQSVVVTLSTDTVVPFADRTMTTTPVGISLDAGGGRQPKYPVMITIGYRAQDVAGLDESRLVIARYDEANGRWLPLPSTVNRSNRTVSAVTGHLSRFAILQLALGRDLSTVKVGPNPFDPRRGPVSITGLPPSAKVSIFTLNGELVRELASGALSDAVAWDGKNRDGNVVASGVYIAAIEGGGAKKKLKIAVQR